MRTGKWVAVASGLAVLIAIQATPLLADIASDRAAAILLFPKIVHDTEAGVDSVIQITNTSNDPVLLHCFYVNANNHCSVSGVVCGGTRQPCPSSGDLCLPSWIETDFRVVLTSQQPIAWRASDGLFEVPLDGFFRRGPNGESNVGTRVPPVPAEPLELGADPDIAFQGELKCIVIDETERAVARNVVKGEVTIVTGDFGNVVDDRFLDVEKYNAVGIQAINGDENGDNVLELGGDTGEYNGCASVLIADHFFDFATNPVSNQPIFTDLTLVPCQQDLLNQVPGGGTAQYLVFNEFEQRFSTSTPIQCFFETQLSQIDTRNTSRSIFSVFVSGTLSGQTRIRGVGTGFTGVLRERHGADFIEVVGDRDTARTAAFNLQMQGVRPETDTIVLP